MYMNMNVFLPLPLLLFKLGLDRQIPGNIEHTAVPSLQGYFVLGYSSVYVHSCVYVVYTYAHAHVYSFLRVEVRGQYPESSLVDLHLTVRALIFITEPEA